MSRVDIGFAEECETWRLTSRFFPSKIGGKPAWLDLKNIPTKKDVECKLCTNPCIFLCQIYSPYEEDVGAFHRMIYIFICKDTECCRENEHGNLRVFRSQLPRENEFYPSDPPEDREDWRQDITAEKWVKTCQVCGILAPSQCSKCKKMNYCCREHQVYDWKNGHKSLCGTNVTTEASSILFPEFELVTEPEESSGQNSEEEDLDRERQELSKFEQLVQSGKAGTLQDEAAVDGDLLKMASCTEDETFSEFSSRVKKYPDQVLRHERGGATLYISSKNQPKDIKKCQECGGDRQFEFQIMPQLLNYFKFEDAFKSLDWGILAVFTCKSSCTPKNGYTLEYIWKQDIVEEEESTVSENKDNPL